MSKQNKQDLDFIEEVPEPAPIPDMDRERTALFTMISHLSDINEANMETYADKIRADAVHLVEKGYDTFVVSHNNNYGIIALHTLLELKDELGFKLISVRVSMDRQNLFNDMLQDVLLKICYCEHIIESIWSDEFYKKICKRVSMISYENGLGSMKDLDIILTIHAYLAGITLRFIRNRKNASASNAKGIH